MVHLKVSLGMIMRRGQNWGFLFVHCLFEDLEEKVMDCHLSTCEATFQVKSVRGVLDVI